MKYTEHRHQCALIEWAHRTKLPPASDIVEGSTIGDYLFSCPMGGKRPPREAARLKAEGAKAGISDLILPLRRHGCGGLFLEMKAPGERPTKLQQAWLDRMDRAGYVATYRDNWIEAACVIARYVGVREPMQNLRNAASKATQEA